jgi:hypothetical protein
VRFRICCASVKGGVAEIEAEDPIDARAMFRQLDLSNEVLDGEFRVRGVAKLRP